MHRHGIRAIMAPPRRVRTTDSRHTLPIAPNLIDRDFTAAAPNRVWLADITYIPTHEGWLYLAAVMNLYSRKIVGWAMRDHLRTELAATALAMAVQRQRPAAGLIHHSDRGVQYASHTYRSALAAAVMTASMSRKADCFDNDRDGAKNSLAPSTNSGEDQISPWIMWLTGRDNGPHGSTLKPVALAGRTGLFTQRIEQDLGCPQIGRIERVREPAMDGC
jgi:transposase InsO family protein